MFALGWRKENGHELDRDMQGALQLYRRAAECGHARSQYKLALALMAGADGVEKDEKQAVELLWQAAERGDSKSKFKLCELVTGGDPALAVERLDRLVSACRVPPAHVAMMCSNNEPVFWRLFARYRIDARAPAFKEFRDKHWWFLENDSEDAPIFPQIIERSVHSFTSDSIPCLLQHLQCGFSANFVGNMVTSRNSNLVDDAVTCFLLEEGWNAFEAPALQARLPGLEPACTALAATQVWLHQELPPTTGLLKPLAEIVFDYLPWFMPFRAFNTRRLAAAPASSASSNALKPDAS